MAHGDADGPSESAVSTTTSVTVSDYVGFLRRRGLIVVIGVLTGLVVAMTILTVHPKTYKATAQVLVLPATTEAAADFSTDLINLDTEARLVTSAQVLSDASQLLDGATDARSLPEHVEVTVATNTTILAVTYRASTGEQAMRGADALAAAYLTNRLTSAAADLSARRMALSRALNELRTDFEAETAALGPTGDTANNVTLQRLIEALRARSAELDILSSSDVLGGRVIRDAVVPNTPDSPRPSTVTVSCLLAGLLLGIGGGAVRQRWDTRVRDEMDIARHYQWPVLATLQAGHSPAAGRQRLRLGNAVLAAARKLGPVRAVLVQITSPGAAVVATRLGEAMACAGHRTLLLRPSRAERYESAEPEAHPAGADDLLSTRCYTPETLSSLLSMARFDGRMAVVEAPDETSNLGPSPLLDVTVVAVEYGRTRRAAAASALAPGGCRAAPLIGVVAVQGRAL